MTGNFFIVDRRNWAEVCRLGMNPAVSYLVLARGSQRDNRHTSWSVNAIKTYGGISVERGKQALETLLANLFIQQTKTGTRPQYAILPWCERLKARAHGLRERHPLSPQEQRFYDAVKTGKTDFTYAQEELAARLCATGWLYQEGESFVADSPQPSTPDLAANLIWLPNELVRGTEAGDPSPLDRLRGSQDVMLLRLLVDLYHDQNLRDDGGIKRSEMRLQFKRLKVGEQGAHTVWAFKRERTLMNWTETSSCHKTALPDPGAAFFGRLDALRKEGLLVFVPHLCESTDAQSEIIHPYGTDWSTKGLDDPENAVGKAAHDAGLAMADPGPLLADEAEGYSLLAPVSSSCPEAQMIGVARLQYPPLTRRTVAWWEELYTKLPRHINEYRRLTTKADQQRAKNRRA